MLLLLVTYGVWSKKLVLLQQPLPLVLKHVVVKKQIKFVVLLECYKLPLLPTLQMLVTLLLLLLLQLKPLMLGLPRENKLLLNGPRTGTKVEVLLLQLPTLHPFSSILDSLKATPTNGDVKSPLSTQSELMLFINPLGSSVLSLYQ